MVVIGAVSAYSLKVRRRIQSTMLGCFRPFWLCFQSWLCLVDLLGILLLLAFFFPLFHDRRGVGILNFC